MSLTLPAGIPRAWSQRKVTQRGSPPARAATQGGGGWANAALSQQLGSVLKQKPMSSLGVRDQSAPRVKKAMLPSRLVAQLTFPEPGTKDQQLYGIGWDVRDGEGTEIALPPPAPPSPRVYSYLTWEVGRGALWVCVKLRHLCHQHPSAQTHQALVS